MSDDRAKFKFWYMFRSSWKIITAVILVISAIYYLIRPGHVLNKTFVIEQSFKGNVIIASIATTSSSHIVAYVIDGDTIKLSSGEKVRYIGVDAPEIKHGKQAAKCFGEQAKAKNKDLVAGKTVRLEKDIRDKDKYGRLLRYVYVVATGTKDTFINLELVKDGYAYASSYPPDVEYQDLLSQAQTEARLVKKGLWNKCGKR